MLEFYATPKQSAALRGLAYARADAEYRRERFPELNEGERAHDAKNIVYHLETLDALGVPHWVQNSVLVWAETWRNYAREDTAHAMRPKHIYI